MLRRTPHIAWDIFEEHLDEAAFLWERWECARDSANHTSREVLDGPEERLLAHLDGLVLGGKTVAERLLLPALSDDDAGRLSATAWALLHAQETDYFETVWTEFTTAAEPAQRRAIARALELSHRPDLSARLRERLESADEESAACIINAIAAQGVEELSRISLQPYASALHPQLIAAVLRALPRRAEAGLDALLERGLASHDVETRSAAMETGTMLKRPGTRAACRRLIAERAPDRRFAMAVLALGADASDEARLEGWAQTADLAEDALWALGFTGRPAVAERLLTRLEDENVAALAADSFALITGLTIDGPLARIGEPANLDQSLDDDAAIPPVRPEDDLAVPEPERIRAWWRSNASRFEHQSRYSRGALWNGDAIWAAMHRTATWRRRVLRLGLGREHGACINLRQWERCQSGDAG